MVPRIPVCSIGPGILMVTLLMCAPLCGAASEDGLELLGPHPLEPPNTSSPRDTLRSFELSVEESIRRYRERMPPAVTDQAVAKVLSCMDLSRLPPAERVAQGFYLAVLLAEVLGRVELPPAEDIPGPDQVAAGALDRWTIPRTDITLARTMEGPYEGAWQFTADTLARTPEFFARVQDIPVRPGAMTGFYEEWSHAPGPWLPRDWTENLPGFAYKVVFGQAIWQWIGTILTLAATALLIIGSYRLARKADNVYRSVGQRGHVGRLLATLVAIVLPGLAAEFLDNAVNLTGRRLFFINGGLHVVQAFGVAWLALMLLNAIGEWIVRLRAARANSVDASLVRTVVRLLGIVAIVYLAIYVADLFGIPATPLIASLGVGGLAIALAVRPTLENVIGGFILFADKPVCVGDFCRYGDQVGTVEEIGLRSTRVRSLERTTVTIPNAEFSQLQLDNFSKRDMRLLNTMLTLRYETSPEQMRYILARLRKLLLGHPKVTPEPARVRFVKFDDFSKNVEIFAYLDCQDQNDFLAIQEDILLRIEDIIEEAGTGFAFPSQTAYLARDAGLDHDKTGVSEARVREWRKSGRLPFPEFDADERGKYENTLDYPPAGSPDYTPRTAAGYRATVEETAVLQPENLSDLPAMVARLGTSDPISEFVRGGLSSDTESMLAVWDGGADSQLKEAIIHDLNVLIDGPLIFDEQRFARIELSQTTRELLEASPEGEDLRRLNQLLLFDAFPKILAR